jgi:hypothetical protein
MITAFAYLVREEDIIKRLFKIAMYLDLPKPVQGIPVITQSYQACQDRNFNIYKVTDEIFEELNTNGKDLVHLLLTLIQS